jgi:cytidylate kinase
LALPLLPVRNGIKAVAAHFGFAHLDTGLLYRAVAAKVLAGDDPVNCRAGLIRLIFETMLLRTRKWPKPPVKLQ